MGGTLAGHGAAALAELERQWVEVQALPVGNPGMSGSKLPDIEERLAGLRAHIALDNEQTSAIHQRFRATIEASSALLA
eukprot:NODE_4909_length_629_cov_284.527875.p5 GENE.NODE_4909_length_629_cov_284.527875~~NODE_4909_length_629_cov_284.527875.p5  ORF type:complete len:79 (+),score=18.05 NODE_4909_length_629_cov_284.527875:3-239(+)